MRRNFFFAVCLLLLGLGQANAEQVRVGVIAPLTGGLAVRGADIVNTLKLVEDDLHSRSLKNSYSFTIDDGKCGGANASTTIANKYIHVDKIRFLITACSGETIQAAPIAEREKVLLIAVLSNHKDIKSLGDYIFRTYLDIEPGMELMARTITDDGHKAVAVLTEENTFTMGMKELLLKDLGDKVVYAEDFQPEDGDYRAILLKAMSRKPDALYINNYADKTIIDLLNQAAALNITLQKYSYYQPAVPEVRRATGKNIEGIKFLDQPKINDSSPQFRDFYSRYMKLHPEGPSAELLVRTTYDAANAIVDAVEEVGSDSTKAKEFLYQYKKLGALGLVEFDANGDLKALRYVINEVKNGEVVPFREK